MKLYMKAKTTAPPVPASLNPRGIKVFNESFEGLQKAIDYWLDDFPHTLVLSTSVAPYLIDGTHCVTALVTYESVLT